MGQITATRNLVATKVVRLAGQQVNTYLRLGYIEEKFVRFEIGIAAPHQTLWDLFWSVRSSRGGYHIS